MAEKDVTVRSIFLKGCVSYTHLHHCNHLHSCPTSRSLTHGHLSLDWKHICRGHFGGHGPRKISCYHNVDSWPCV